MDSKIVITHKKHTVIKNNNPLRLKYHRSRIYTGECYPDKHGFRTFATLADGFRAGFILLNRYRASFELSIERVCRYFASGQLDKVTEPESLISYVVGCFCEFFGTTYTRISVLTKPSELICMVFYLTCYQQGFVDPDWLDDIESVSVSKVGI